MSAGPICWWWRRARGQRHMAVVEDRDVGMHNVLGVRDRRRRCSRRCTPSVRTAAGRLPLPVPPGSAPAAARADRRRPGAPLAVRAGPLLVCLSTQGAVVPLFLSLACCAGSYRPRTLQPGLAGSRVRSGRWAPKRGARVGSRPGPLIAVVATPPTRGDARGKCWNAVHPASQLITIRCLECRLHCQSPAAATVASLRSRARRAAARARREGKLAVAPSRIERNRSHLASKEVAAKNAIIRIGHGWSVLDTRLRGYHLTRKSGSARAHREHHTEVN